MGSPNEDYNMEISAEEHNYSSTSCCKNIKYNLLCESDHGATNSDEVGPSKEKKMILDSNMDSQQIDLYSGRPDHPAESYRVLDSSVSASFKELMSLKVPLELQIATETLGKFYRDNDPNIKKFFKDLVKVLKESDSESSKTWSSHAGTVKVHKIVTGETYGADEALLKQLNCKELQVKMADRQGCDIIILFCPINSRVGSDVESAMSQVSDDQITSGPSPTVPQGFDPRTEKENRNGNLHVNGATNDDEVGPSKEKKMIVDSSMDTQLVAPHSGRPDHPAESYRVLDSAVSASFEKQRPLNVPSETKQGDQASSGHLTSNLQGFDPRTEKESRNGNLHVNGATNSDEVGPPKEKKMILDSSVNPLQVATYSGRPDRPAGSNIVLDSAVSASFQENKELKASLEVTHQQIADLQRDNSELRSTLTAVTSEVSTLKQENKSLKETVLDILESTPDNPESLLTAKTELKSLKVPPELHNAESNKTLSSHAGLVKTVKVHKIVTGRTFGADEALLKQLNCKELQVKMTDRQGCDIIILFCPINSRVGSDVELAMSQVSGVEQVILILMHHTRDVDYSTAAKRWSETFDNVIFDVNILYHQTEPGLLKCLKNKEAISDICEELMQYSSSTNQSKSNWSWSIGSFFGRAAGTVKVHKIVTGKTFGADEALLKQLNCKELQVKMTDRQGCDIIILFCPINSCVGSDVELAMRQVSGVERVILILMHHTRDVDYSTSAKRWSETFDNVVFDVNVLYHETEPGLLKCLKNTEAINDICKELVQYK